MQRRTSLLWLVLGVCFLAALTAYRLRKVNPVEAQEAASAPKTASPAEGYNIHVLAPHLVDGKQMGPYHHY